MHDTLQRMQMKHSGAVSMVAVLTAPLCFICIRFQLPTSNTMSTQVSWRSLRVSACRWSLTCIGASPRWRVTACTAAFLSFKR